MFKEFKIQIFSLLILLLTLPLSSFAQTPSVTFSSGPSAEFDDSGGQITASIGGSINIQGSGITVDDVIIAYDIFDTPVDTSYMGSFGHYFYGSDDLFPQSGQYGFFTTISSQGFTPGSTYYFIFRVAPNSNPTQFPFQQVVVQATVPGTSSGNGGGGTNQTGNGNNPNNSGGQNPTDPEIAADGWQQGVLENPLEVDSINSFITGLLEALLKIGIPVMVVFLVYSGLRLVMARGNEKELANAKKNLLWVIIGAAVLLSAWTIVRILKGTFDELDLVFISNLIDYFV